MSKETKTNWRLSQIYKSEKELDRELEKIEKKYHWFEKKYKNKKFTKTNRSFLSALKDYEKLEKIYPHRPYFYLHLKNSLNSADQKVEAKMNKVEEKLRKLSNKVLFFELEIGKVSKKRQKEILKDRKLKHFKHYLEEVFKKAEYQLTEPEEKILNLKSQPSRGLWISGREKAQDKLTFEFGGKEIPVSEAISRISQDMPVKKRRELWRKLIKEVMKTADFAEAELNAVVIDKKINDELRGYGKPYSATILGYENTEDEVEALVSKVTQGFRISRKFYKLKARVLGLEGKMEYTDRLAQIGKVKKKFDFESSVEILKKSLKSADEKYTDIFDKLHGSSQIDVYPKKGKQGGAFCAPAPGVPTYVLLNHTDDISSLRTLAHEMGHAIHSERSKRQPVLYEDYTISVAEVASTFFENVAFGRVYEDLSEKEKIAALGSKIDDKIGTIFRQISFFNYELDLHNSIREKGSLSHKEMAQLMQKHLKAYCGPALNVSAEDGYTFIYIPHFRMMFYVYAYAYGELVSSALYGRYKEDPRYIKKIDKFLSAGGSKSPYDIFKDIGIDTRSPDFWEEGLKEVEREIKEFEKLVETKKK